ncbi:MAG: hypothetical protein LGB07_02840 [Sulfurovum sp.]|nr:hypothetical protein [Sulfurovum sp.]MCB4744577.1 hypothetical protein [Sulfurovum sp.]MCB4746863.1 hypothetical protein [Sulfurovum sp.]MCB4747018.1 hypothetical protein [Sulfurovum sp.]MCB4748546.1 hypothetical protein [Sulfurovum sp.]
MKWTIGVVLGIFLLESTGFAKSPKYDVSRYKYIGVFSKVKASQQMVATMELRQIRKQIKQAWQKGNDIKELKYGNGHWVGVFEKGDARSHQTYLVASRWSAIDHIVEDYWKQGYFITNIEHGLAEWVVVFEKNTGFLNQAYERRAKRDAFIEVVNQRWKQGYDLIDFEYGEGHYTGIFTERKTKESQALVVRSTWFNSSKAITEYWHKGYRIKNIEYTLGRWMILFGRNSKDSKQGFETAHDIETFKTIFEKRQKEGYVLIDLAEGW